jgi:hypothetical protein
MACRHRRLAILVLAGWCFIFVGCRVPIVSGPGVGDTITYSDVDVVLVSVTVLPDGDQRARLPLGLANVVTHLRLTSHSLNAIAFNFEEFAVRMGNGAISTGSGVHYGTILDDRQPIGPGHTIEGNMVFQAPPHDSQAALIWKPAGLPDKLSYSWNLGL